MRSIRTILAVALISMTATANAAVIELALLLDRSGSMIAGGAYETQYQAYGSIFSNNFYTNVLVNNGQAGDELIVSAYTFDTTTQQILTATSITDDASAAAFGAMFTAANFGTAAGQTYTGDALEKAIDDILTAGLASDKKIIDVSTDGNPYPSSQEIKSYNQAQRAHNNDITINAIGIGSSVSTSYLSNLTSTANGFFIETSDISGFQTGLETKLHREITSLPGPAGLILFGMGLMGLGLRRKG